MSRYFANDREGNADTLQLEVYMRALVTGPRGFVGARIMDELAGEAIPAPSLRNVCEEDIRRIVDAAQPDVIIHTAAMSDISDCANDPGGSYRANVEIPIWLAGTGIKCVMFSTDQVYSGCTGAGPYVETDVAPANLYAQHKMEMEQRTLEINPETVHLRATWMYDMPKYGVPNRSNFLMKMFRDHDVYFSSAEHRAVTYVREVAENIRKAALLPGGAYNYGSENDLTMMEVAEWFKNELALPVAIHDTFSDRHLWMDCSKIKSYGIDFCTTIDGLQRCIADYAL